MFFVVHGTEDAIQKLEVPQPVRPPHKPLGASQSVKPQIPSPRLRTSPLPPEEVVPKSTTSVSSSVLAHPAANPRQNSATLPHMSSFRDGKNSESAFLDRPPAVPPPRAATLDNQTKHAASIPSEGAKHLGKGATTAPAALQRTPTSSRVGACAPTKPSADEVQPWSCGADGEAQDGNIDLFFF
jgi:hypothetical protein